MLASDQELAKVRKDLDLAQKEARELRDESHRLKNTIVNKDSENLTLQSLGDKEKERREAETSELRRLLSQE